MQIAGRTLRVAIACSKFISDKARARTDRPGAGQPSHSAACVPMERSGKHDAIVPHFLLKRGVLGGDGSSRRRLVRMRLR